MGTIRKFAELIEGHRNRWLALVVFAASVSALDAVAALLVFALLQMLTSSEASFDLPTVGDVGRFWPSLDSSDLLLLGGGVVAGVFLTRSAAFVLLRYLQHRVAENTGVDVARRLVAGYLSMPYAYHLHRNSAELVRNANDSTQRLPGEVFLPILHVSSEGLIVVSIGCVLLASAPGATGLATLIFTPTVLVLVRLVQPRLKRLGRVGQEMARTSLQSLQQAFGGLRDVKLLGRESFFVDDFIQHRRRRARARYLYGFAKELPRVTMETVLVLSIAGVLAITILGGRSPTDLIAVLGLFGYAAFRVIPSLGRVVTGFNHLKFGSATLEDVHRDLHFFDEHGQRATREKPGSPALHRGIVLEDVSYRYEGTETDALQAVSLSILAHTSLGIVGPTGGGKTTLVDLLTGLLVPTAGRILVDGVDIQEDARKWQRGLGVVHQSVFLLDDTLRRNIAFGVEEQTIDEDRLAESVRLAQLQEFVRSLPEGLNTLVGERGVRISGGQRQRVSIARALYRQPKVLILDEATSALDHATERRFLHSIAEGLPHLTIVTIAHRISTVRDCDQIAIVSDGQVADVGTYAELCQLSEAFRTLSESVGT